MPRNASRLLVTWVLSLLAAALPLAAQTASDLVITMSDDPDPVLDGGQVTYTIVVTNGGPDDVQGLELLDSLPPSGTLGSITPPAGWACTGPPPGGFTVSCTSPSMASGTSATFTLVLDLYLSGGGSFTNVAGISATKNTDPVPENNNAMETTTIQVWSDVSVLVTDAPDPVEAGAGLTYTITVGEGQSAGLPNIELSGTLPSGTTFLGLGAPSE
jgi:uncharacterized repeat protein (TIGR01451 family)